MATDIIMPQLGESIAEGTVAKWLVARGGPVERDQPLLEVETDKVALEIPSPATGVLTDILVREGETVPVGTLLARLDGQPPWTDLPTSRSSVWLTPACFIGAIASASNKRPCWRPV